MKKFHITTFGCQMNKHDSERMAGLLSSHGYEQSDNSENAQILIFNTCAVRGNAENRFFGNLNNLRARKKHEPGLIIAVGGCSAQKEREHIFKNAPHVDIVFGTLNLPDLAQMIESVERTREAVCGISEKIEIMPTTLPSQREEAHHAWVPIIIGCNNFCSYCIVPYTRGREVSRSREDILNDVRRLVADGVIEITLLGQNVNSYGHDLYGKRYGNSQSNDKGLDNANSVNVLIGGNDNANSSHFARLLEDLNDIDGLRRVRFMTSHPKDLTDDTIEAIARGNKICKHIHLPVQAGSDRILKIMNRKYTKAKYLETVEKIYRAIPGVSLTSDIMVGFPGETEEDFLETLDVVEKARYDGAFTFIFSPREGTPAARMEDQVPDNIKSERFDRLLALQNRIGLEKNSEMIGKTIDVFVECTSKKDENILSGRTGTNKIVNFAGPKNLVHGEARVEITEAYTWHLSGKLK